MRLTWPSVGPKLPGGSYHHLAKDAKKQIWFNLANCPTSWFLLVLIYFVYFIYFVPPFGKGCWKANMVQPQCPDSVVKTNQPGLIQWSLRHWDQLVSSPTNCQIKLNEHRYALLNLRKLSIDVRREKNFVFSIRTHQPPLVAVYQFCENVEVPNPSKSVVTMSQIWPFFVWEQLWQSFPKNLMKSFLNNLMKIGVPNSPAVFYLPSCYRSWS